MGAEKIAGFASSYRIAYDDERRVYAVNVGAGEACDLLILIERFNCSARNSNQHPVKQPSVVIRIFVLE
ncbi:hypothetical protein TU81_07595 [Pseudomonas lini]|nr:hypothetical protein TU81_07595 [Pseudomonas lini]